MPPGAVAAPMLEGSTMLSEPLLWPLATVATLGSSRPRDDSGCIYSIHPMCSAGITCVSLVWCHLGSDVMSSGQCHPYDTLPSVSRAGIILVVRKGKLRLRAGQTGSHHPVERRSSWASP